MFGGIHRLFSRFGRTALVLGLFVGIGLMLHAAVPSVAYAYEPPDSSWSSTLVNFVGTTLAQIINFLGDGIGSLTLVIIEVIVVNILNYNNFSSSNIVTLGWTLTRDMVNMFAVIVLLILAVKTMIGQTANAWQQHLPRFFLGIVFANFSRTLCGLAVDASQIVMMTFVNALMSIAAGNFAQLMVMPSATTYSSETFQGATEAGVTLVTLAANIANAYMKLLVQVAVMVVILLLAIAFIWRIIVLWIAFIMAPLAAFSWGSKEIVGFLGRLYQEWMGAFVPPLILGPMLAFFLYLALAASSNGNLAKTEAFPEPEKRTTYGQITLEIFESTNFTGLLLAIVFLLMGLKESAKTAAKMGGLAAMALNDKTGKRVLSMGRTISGKTLAAPLTGARIAGQAFGATGRGLASNSLASTNLMSSSPRLNAALQGVGKLGQKAGRGMNVLSDNKAAEMAKKGLQLAESPLEASMRGGKTAAKYTGRLATAVGAATGMDSLMKAGSAIDAKLHTMSEKDSKAAKDRVGHMTDEQKVARLMSAVQGNGEQTNEILDDAKMLRGELFTNKDFAKQLKAQVGEAKFDEIVENTLTEFDHHEHDRPLDKEGWNKARSQYADIYSKVDATNASKFIDSKDFDGRLMRDEALRATNPQRAAVIAALKASSTDKTENGRVVTKLDELNRGNYGSGKVAAGLAASMPGVVSAGDKEEMGRMFSRGGAAHLEQKNLSNAAVIESLIQGNVKPTNLATEEVSREAAAAAAAGRAPTITSASVQQEFATQVMQTQEVENITKAFDNGQFNESHVTDAMLNAATNPNADRAILALAQSQKMDFSKMNAAAVSQINAQLAAMEAAGGRISADDAGTLRKKMLQAGKTVADVIPGVDADPATNPSMSLGGAERVKVQQLFRVDPSSISQIKAAVGSAAASTTRNDFTKTVVEGLSKEDFKKLSDMFSKETNAGRKAAIKDAMETINKALIVHESTASSPDERKRIKGLRSAHDSADRYMI